MARLMFITLFPFLLLLLFMPGVEAKEVTAPVAKKKKLSSKAVATKRRIIKGTNVAKKRAVSNRKVNASARSAKKTVRKNIASRNQYKRLKGRVARARTVQARQARQAIKRPVAYTVRDLESRPELLKAAAAYVLDESNAEVLYAKNEKAALPIASITKLMTALIVVEAKQDMSEVLQVTRDDIDTIKFTSSRLPIGSKLTRANMLHIALMSSENRAASALGRHYPGGLSSFVRAMNTKAKQLGMSDTQFVEPTGLSSHNVSSPRDLAKLVLAAYEHPAIRKYSTYKKYEVNTGSHVLHYRNSNRLIANSDWKIGVQKTGYISEAGRCLVMQAVIKGRSIIIVFLGSQGKLSRVADAGSIRTWLEQYKLPALAQAEKRIEG